MDSRFLKIPEGVLATWVVSNFNTLEVAEAVNALYDTIMTAGTHKACSIQVAEAGQAIENTQRDLNIALMNEQ